MTNFDVRRCLACVWLLAGCTDTSPGAHAGARAPGCDDRCTASFDGVLVDPRAKAPQVVVIDEDSSRWEILHSVAIDASGRRVATGEGFSPITGLAWTSAFADDGRDLWIDRHDPGAEGHDIGNAVATASDGTVYVAGQWYSSSNTRWSSFVRALSPTGQPLWSRDGEAVGDDDFRGLALDESRDALYAVGAQADAGWIRRLDRGGATVWERALTSAAADVVVDDDGRAIVIGGAHVVAYTSDGEIAWSDTRTDELLAISRGDDGTLAIAGSAGLVARYFADGRRRDELHADGASVWRGIALASDGTIVVAAADLLRAYTAELAPAWQVSQPDLTAQDVAIDGTGNIVIVGAIRDSMAMVTYYR